MPQIGPMDRKIIKWVRIVKLDKKVVKLTILLKPQPGQGNHCAFTAAVSATDHRDRPIEIDGQIRNSADSVIPLNHQSSQARRLIPGGDFPIFDQIFFSL